MEVAKADMGEAVCRLLTGLKKGRDEELETQRYDGSDRYKDCVQLRPNLESASRRWIIMCSGSSLLIF